jgi:uncharacterized protein (TIGR02677 family)
MNYSLNTTDTQISAADFEVFAHLQAENFLLYRRVLSVFVLAQQRFTIALRPSDVCDALRAEIGEDLPATSVLDALAQLTRWGNLDATQDTADVNTVEEFYRARFLYQLSAAGETAEGALQYFAQNLGQHGELKAAALRDIVQHLEQLQVALLHPDEFDQALAHRVLKALVERFQELTSRAQTFLRTVQRPLELHRLEADTFLRFKTQLIDYLERFISELVVATNQIAERILHLDDLGVDRALELATAHDLADDILATPEARAAKAVQWRQRWDGLRQWFVGTPERGSQAELLRSRARSAIPALLTALASINDRRASRIDRATEWMTLAAWFAETKDDESAHRLWRSAFALHPARHLHIDDATLIARAESEESPRISWLDATPMAISPQLRLTGRQSPRGPARSIVDRSAAKALLAELARKEAAELARAQTVLATGRPALLSSYAKLSSLEFGLLLDLLGEALAKRGHGTQTIATTSSDGSLRIVLQPIPDAPLATVHTSFGDFTGPEHTVTISRNRGARR